MVILYLLGIIISGGILISFFTSGNYDTGKKSVSNTLSIQAANKNTLNAFNYLTVQPDFVFQKMNRHCMGLTSQYAEIANTFQCNKDFYGITGELYTIGNRQKTKDKYLGKIIKTPFMAWAYSNSGNTVYLSDEGYVEEGLATRDYVYCRLVDEENIKKYADESKLNRGTFDVIGVLSSIDTYEGILVLDPCFYIKKHNSNSSSSSKSSYNTPQISSNLTLDISKPVYEKNENIALLAQWIGPDIDCKILEEKVKETLVSRHFEIVDGSFSCAGNDNKSLIQLRVQFKSPRIGKLNIPSIKLNNVSGNSVDFSVRDLETLQNAVISKNVESIKAFLSSSSDLDEIKIDGEHPVAHFIKDDMAFAQELIKLGASADVIDKNGYTPLMYAVIRQDNDFLDLLLKKKVYLNEVDKKGRTAIMYAAIKNNLYAAKKLIGHRADIYKSKDEKWSAYIYAKEMKHYEIAELLKGNKDRIVLVIDNCDDCKAKEKIFLKLTKNYPSLPRSDILTITPNNDKKSKEHYWDKKFPLVKFGDGKTLDSDFTNAFRPGHRLDNWDGTEKQLETIMYKD